MFQRGKKIDLSFDGLRVARFYEVSPRFREVSRGFTEVSRSFTKFREVSPAAPHLSKK